ncbi:MAG: glycosyltransferase family 4 protein [Myxococcaceae bacterium]
MVVHPHFHARRTGVTRHVESVVRALGAHFTARALGWALSRQTPRLTWTEFWGQLRAGTVVWHAHRNLELLMGLLVRALTRRLRVVFSRHSAKPASRYTRFLAQRADARIALTEQVRTGLGLSAEIVPHGVDLDAFRPLVDRAQAWRALGLGGRFGIGVVGRIRPDKGQGDFAEAIAPLQKSHPDWTPVLVGGVRPRDEAFRNTLRLQLPRLQFVGETESPERWLAGLSIVVHPSHDEAYSMVLLEAMASGACLVASDLPNMRAVIANGDTGFLFPPGDVMGLRKLLARLLDNPDEVDKVGRAAAAAARARFGVATEATALAQVYRKVISA